MTAGVSSTEPPGTVVTPPREDTDRDSRTRRDEPWRVIVLNDDHNTFEGVAFVLSRVIPDVSYEQGLRIADRIHNSGRAVVWSGHLEVAEHYWQRLQGAGLTMAPLEQ